MRSGKGRGGFGTALQQSAVPFFSSSPHHAPPFPSPASRLPLPPSSEHPPLTGWIPLRSHSKRSQNRYKSAEEARTAPSAHAASDLHDAGLRIQYAAFDEDGAVKLSGAEKSVQGNAWQAASAEGWGPPAGLTQDLDGLWKKAEVRHADACSTCHGAPKASAHTANEWAGQLPKRGGRTGHSSAGANELMFKWLQAHAKPM